VNTFSAKNNNIDKSHKYKIICTYPRSIPLLIFSFSLIHHCIERKNEVSYWLQPFGLKDRSHISKKRSRKECYKISSKEQALVEHVKTFQLLLNKKRSYSLLTIRTISKMLFLFEIIFLMQTIGNYYLN
jgi:hypothetical protein